MNKLKMIIKVLIRTISELLTTVYFYKIILCITNASDELTILNVILSIIYSILSINVFEWAWSEKND